jgi:peptidoglycan/xylan/chitin deacetylase (PgdA/CDA1 family)
LNQQNKILLSFDVEEFDLPLEYRQHVSIDGQLSAGIKGLHAIKPLLDQPQVKTTLFTTAYFAGAFPEDIKTLSERHEIASHSFYHTKFDIEDLYQSRIAIENIISKPVRGLRMPRLKKIESSLVKAAGYTYNSSINPTWIPGRYNNLDLPRIPFSEAGIIQFPVSVTQRLRIPLFWLAFKNLPYSVFLKMALHTLKHDGFLSLYFHPWEFTDISSFKLPIYITRGSRGSLLHKIERLVKDLSNAGEFMSISDYIQTAGANL